MARHVLVPRRVAVRLRRRHAVRAVLVAVAMLFLVSPLPRLVAYPLAVATALAEVGPAAAPACLSQLVPGGPRPYAYTPGGAPRHGALLVEPPEEAVRAYAAALRSPAGATVA